MKVFFFFFQTNIWENVCNLVDVLINADGNSSFMNWLNFGIPIMFSEWMCVLKKKFDFIFNSLLMNPYHHRNYHHQHHDCRRPVSQENQSWRLASTNASTQLQCLFSVWHSIRTQCESHWKSLHLQNKHTNQQTNTQQKKNHWVGERENMLCLWKKIRTSNKHNYTSTVVCLCARVWSFTFLFSPSLKSTQT